MQLVHGGFSTVTAMPCQGLFDILLNDYPLGKNPRRAVAIGSPEYGLIKLLIQPTIPPYSTELAQAPGWNYCVKGLEALFYDHPAPGNERLTFYLSFSFMNDKPYSIGRYIDPPDEYNPSHVGAPVDIF